MIRRKHTEDAETEAFFRIAEFISVLLLPWAAAWLAAVFIGGGPIFFLIGGVYAAYKLRQKLALVIHAAVLVAFCVWWYNTYL